MIFPQSTRIQTRTFTGSEPGVGKFDVRLSSDGEDWCVVILPRYRQRIERYCSVWRNEPCHGLTKVYEILREAGFTISGQTREAT